MNETISIHTHTYTHTHFLSFFLSLFLFYTHYASLFLFFLSLPRMHQDVAVAVLAFVWDRLYVATLFCALYPLQLSATSFVHWNPLKDSLGRNIIQGTWKRARAKFLHLSLNIKISLKKKIIGTCVYECVSVCVWVCVCMCEGKFKPMYLDRLDFSQSAACLLPLLGQHHFQSGHFLPVAWKGERIPIIKRQALVILI